MYTVFFIYIFICMYVYMFVKTFAHIYTHEYTYIYTHICTYAEACSHSMAFPSQSCCGAGTLLRNMLVLPIYGFFVCHLTASACTRSVDTDRQCGALQQRSDRTYNARELHCAWCGYAAPVCEGRCCQRGRANLRVSSGWQQQHRDRPRRKPTLLSR